MLVVASSIVFFAAQPASGATIPAGTPLTVRLTSAMSSRYSAGREFHGTLARPVKVDGAIVVPAGTHVVGVVQSPQVRIASTTRPFTLRLTEMSLGNRKVPIKTTPFEAKDTSPGRVGRRQVQLTGSAFLLPAGTTIQFQLSQLVNV